MITYYKPSFAPPESFEFKIYPIDTATAGEMTSQSRKSPTSAEAATVEEKRVEIDTNDNNNKIRVKVRKDKGEEEDKANCVPPLCPTHHVHLLEAVDYVHAAASDVRGFNPYNCIFGDPDGEGLYLLGDMPSLKRCPGISSTFYVCPNDDCAYCVCASCFGTNGLRNKLKAKALGFAYTIRRYGIHPYIGAVVIIAAQSLYLPITRTSLMIIGCHNTFWCLFPGCYAEPTPLFVLSVVASVLALSFFTIGLVASLFYLLLRRWRHVKGIIPGWDSLLLSDRSLLKVLYAAYSQRWLWVQPFTLVFKALLVLPIVFLAPSSLSQLVAVSAIETSQALFWIFTSPFANKWVGFLTHVGCVHQLGQLCLMALDRAAFVSTDDPLTTASSSKTYGNAMWGLFAAYLFTLAIVVAATVVYPIVNSLIVPNPVEGAERRLGACLARAAALSRLYRSFPTKSLDDEVAFGKWVEDVKKNIPRSEEVEELIRILLKNTISGDNFAPFVTAPSDTTVLKTIDTDAFIVRLLIAHGNTFWGIPFSKGRKTRFEVLAEAHPLLSDLERAIAAEELLLSGLWYALDDPQATLVAMKWTLDTELFASHSNLEPITRFFKITIARRRNLIFGRQKDELAAVGEGGGKDASVDAPSPFSEFYVRAARKGLVHCFRLIRKHEAKVFLEKTRLGRGLMEANIVLVRGDGAESSMKSEENEVRSQTDATLEYSYREGSKEGDQQDNPGPSPEDADGERALYESSLRQLDSLSPACLCPLDPSLNLLHWAAASGGPAFITMLIREEAYVRTASKKFGSLLLYACRFRQWDSVKVLLMAEWIHKLVLGGNDIETISEEITIGRGLLGCPSRLFATLFIRHMKRKLAGVDAVRYGRLSSSSKASEPLRHILLSEEKEGQVSDDDNNSYSASPAAHLRPSPDTSSMDVTARALHDLSKDISLAYVSALTRGRAQETLAFDDRDPHYSEKRRALLPNFDENLAFVLGYLISFDPDLLRASFTSVRGLVEITTKYASKATFVTVMRILANALSTSAAGFLENTCDGGKSLGLRHEANDDVGVADGDDATTAKEKHKIIGELKPLINIIRSKATIKAAISSDNSGLLRFLLTAEDEDLFFSSSPLCPPLSSNSTTKVSENGKSKGKEIDATPSSQAEKKKEAEILAPPPSKSKCGGLSPDELMAAVMSSEAADCLAVLLFTFSYSRSSRTHPLFVAIEKSRDMIVSSLLAADPTLITIRDEKGLNPLHYAVKCNYPLVSKAVLEAEGGPYLVQEAPAEIPEDGKVLINTINIVVDHENTHTTQTHADDPAPAAFHAANSEEEKSSSSSEKHDKGENTNASDEDQKDHDERGEDDEESDDEEESQAGDPFDMVTAKRLTPIAFAHEFLEGYFHDEVVGMMANKLKAVGIPLANAAEYLKRKDNDDDLESDSSDESDDNDDDDDDDGDDESGDETCEIEISEPKKNNTDRPSALQIAAFTGDLVVVKSLLSILEDDSRPHGGGMYMYECKTQNTFPPPLLLAASRGHTKIVEMLLEGGADPNQRFSTSKIFKNISAVDRGGNSKPLPPAPTSHTSRIVASALLVAAMNGHSRTVALLLRHGAVQHISNPRPVTSLRNAPSFTCVESLLRAE